ncbi:MAG: aminopeptidase P family protein [Candidatus Liptonbacteria bacterium]|nr:aminopeptidase P family protein [Candidatus Liptonbacteria bacterium]
MKNSSRKFLTGWDSGEIARHSRAADLLTSITRHVWEYVRSHPKITEYEIEQFVREEFRKNNLASPKPFDTQIVAFNEHAASIHYFPPSENSAKLAPNTLILLDIWARLRKSRSPFADITWVAFHGRKIPSEIQKVFDIVIGARDACVKYLENNLEKKKIPTGAEIDLVARQAIWSAGYGEYFYHGGHCIGFASPHGKGVNISPKFPQRLQKNVGYTIEPGIYLPGKFGIRSEINFYIDSRCKLIITTSLQRHIIKT